MHVFSKFPLLLLHFAAGGAALIYAWQMSQTAYLQSGLQFIGPLLVIMAVHLGWLAVRGRLAAGFAGEVYRRSAQSALILCVGLWAGHIFAPLPAQADAEEVITMILTTMFCVAVIGVIVGGIAYAIYLIYKLLMRLFGGGPSGPKTRLFDMGSLGVTTLLLAALSLEDVPGAYSFEARAQTTAVHVIDAPSEAVWAAMETATSPDWPLHDLLSVFPQPVAVTRDEGTALGAMRQVAFEGREGAGHLTLQVIERDATRAVFDVLSDTSPYAMWLGHERLTYDVIPQDAQTELRVTLEYERRLAPAWFFGPAMKGAALLAMDVLARDVKTRSEG